LKSLTFFRIELEFPPFPETYNELINTDSDVYTHLKQFNNTFNETIFQENFFYQIVSSVLFSGKKNKINIAMLQTFKKFYSLSCYNNNQALESYSFWKEYQYNMSLNFYVYNIMFLINWVMLTLKPIFNIQCQTVPKKYRKHLKTNYIYKVRYLPERKRFKTAIKWISIDILSSVDRVSTNKILTTMMDLILNFKTSKIYSNKLKIYAYLLKIK
jgi:hypothetical protein